MYLEPRGQPVTQLPYQTKPIAREFVAEKVERMRKVNMIEPATSAWALLTSGHCAQARRILSHIN